MGWIKDAKANTAGRHAELAELEGQTVLAAAPAETCAPCFLLWSDRG
jgi:hypothetical protein